MCNHDINDNTDEHIDAFWKIIEQQLKLHEAWTF